MTFYYTPLALQKDMLKDLDGVILDIAILAKQIVVDNVQAEVYDKYPESTSKSGYKRQGEDGGFIASWDVGFEIPRRDKNAVAYRIFSNPELMNYIPNEYVHGNPDKDRRNIMDVAIAEGIEWDWSAHKAQEAFDAWGEDIEWWKNPRDYFTPSLEALSEQINDMTFDAYSRIGEVALLKF